MHPKYPHLFSPVNIGSVTLRNRVVMAAMGMSQSDGGFVNKAVLNHYAARANGGVGAVVVEVTCVDAPLGLNTKGMLVIDDDKYIPGMAELAGVRVRLGKELTRSEILALAPDVVVCATGVKPPTLPIPGIERAVHAKRI